MIYFTLNGVEIKSERVGTMPNRSEIEFPSRISRRSRLASAGAEGSFAPDTATWLYQKRPCVLVEVGPRREFLSCNRGSGLTTSGEPAWAERKLLQVGWPSASSIDWACGSQVG